MLPDAQKHDRNARRMHHANQRADHIPHRIALADNKAIQATPRAKAGVKAPGLGHAIRPDQGLADHEDLVRAGRGGEFLQRGHQAGVVVAAAGGVDEDDVEGVGGGMGDGGFGDGGGVFAVALFVEFDLGGAGLAGGQLLEVAGVHAELLDGAGAEGVAGGDEELQVVLEEEEGEFGEVGRFADAVDADDGDYIWSSFGG